MIHTCYHIISNNNHEYFRTLAEVQTRLAKLKTNGENNLIVSQIFTTEDFDVDAICLEEVQIPLADVTYNHDLVKAEMV